MSQSSPSGKGMRPSSRKVGILGGGQLARMLAIEGARLGLEIHIMSPSPADPAAQVTNHWLKGELGDLAAMTELLNRVDAVTIESEFVDPKIVLSAEAASGRQVTPSVRLIAELSDRLQQKAWLEKMKIPTAEFVAVQKSSDVENFFAQPNVSAGRGNRAGRAKGVVVKKRRFGYDGYGTFILRSPSDLESWLSEHGLTSAEFIAEKFVPFRRELAVQFAINARGQICEFPLVEWQARDSKCHWVHGPVKARGFDQLSARLRRALVKSGYVGMIAFEIFDTGRELLVNEVAPRVHNSAHYSIEGLYLNQFAAHLQAVLDLDLPRAPTAAAPGFAMLNLIGSSDQAPVLPMTALNEVFFHWYGKRDNRLGRKMGHVTALGPNGPAALKKLLKIEKKMRV